MKHLDAGNRGDGAGKIIDKNDNVQSFYIAVQRLQLGNSAFKSFKPKVNHAFTITRHGNILSMTCEGLEGEVITTRSDTFKSLTSFSISMTNPNVGISHFSVRSFPESGDAKETSLP